MMFPKVDRLIVKPSSRVVLLGDPHGDLRTTQRIVHRERAIDEDVVIACVGDDIGYADGPTSSAMVEWLEHNMVPMVLGNHEEWYFNENRLSVVDDRRAERKLTESAAVWISGLPHRVDLYYPDSPAVVASIVHSIRTPFWDDVQPHSVSKLMKALPGIGIILIGHSHCARIMVVGSDGATSCKFFDYTELEACDADIRGASTVIVDAGSISRPRTDLRQLSRESVYGTYAVLDLKTGSAGLRRIERGQPSQAV